MQRLQAYDNTQLGLFTYEIFSHTKVCIHQCQTSTNVATYHTYIFFFLLFRLGLRATDASRIYLFFFQYYHFFFLHIIKSRADKQPAS